MYGQILGPRLRTLHGRLLTLQPNPRMHYVVRREFYTCVYTVHAQCSWFVFSIVTIDLRLPVINSNLLNVRKIATCAIK